MPGTVLGAGDTQVSKGQSQPSGKGRQSGMLETNICKNILKSQIWEGLNCGEPSRNLLNPGSQIFWLAKTLPLWE